MNNSAVIYGMGIDIIEKVTIVKVFNSNYYEEYLLRWLTEEEIYCLEDCNNKIDLLSAYIAIKESFIKASNGYMKLKDLKKINVHIRNGVFNLSLENSTFLSNKTCSIEVFQSPDLCIASLTLKLEEEVK
ncbi:4'-phosphopantetheinyl transferase family protein [Alkalihalobacillus pseudalcaliphilus]|uniref:4'-phosphopantetheinyl transferase family protein n=1 Tax=Alkalihalobacillus pseudalcaliphilus TaxID=79884 RepID=UPI00064DCC2D|nr:4'-phosphopantetheinyl transferase superfamily protein [Alkalihalobacillus pseudalcaliphilus]KMK76752.1 hypothetical protein AB990_07500 [Alkalihalobacillus pseudalcaliphilus]